MNTETIKSKKVKILVAVAVVAVIVIAYLAGMFYYSQRFLPRTTVNGFECGGKTVEETKELLKEDVANYELTLKERDDKTETISGDSIDLKMVFDDSLDKAMAERNSTLWFVNLFAPVNIDMATNVEFSKDKLKAQVDELNAVKGDDIVKPEDAHVSDYESGEEYTIVPEVEGNQLRVKKTKRTVREAISQLETTVDLDEEDCYREPTVRSDNEKLAEVVDKMNQYVNTRVKIKFSKKKREIVDGELIHDWLKVDMKNVTVSLDDDKISDYMSELASKYNTIYKPHKFKTYGGSTITIENGDYGWWMNQNGTKAKLVKALNNFKSKTIHAVWLQEAASHGKRDYGKTYVEVNLGAQTLYFIKNGEVLLSSVFVSGNPNTGHNTPGGIYSLTYKTTNHRMVGADYDVFTYYWMPFNGNIGFHDATWRSSFGGSLYLSSGSHGCVNMPFEKAKALYSLVEQGMPVICYW